MADIIRLGAIAVTAALCAVILKKSVRELGLVLSIAAGAVILLQVVGTLEHVRTFMDALADAAGISQAVISPVFKTVGIAVVTRVAAELCRDAEERGLAAFIETAGAVTALWVALPLMKTVLNMITGLL